MTYLRNAWYLAGWDYEFTDKPLARKILGEDLVFYRTSTGQVSALADRCPHRFAPLSDGKVINDNLQCPYHGLQFNDQGKCVLNPHPPGTVGALRVKAYPLAERYSGVWIWAGDAAPDPAVIPDLGVTGRTDGYRVVKGSIPLAANYMLMTDNLLDLTHVPILHDGTVGNADMMRNLTSTLDREGDTVTLTRINTGIPAAPFYQDIYPAYRAMLIEKIQKMHWMAPSNLLLEITHHETGRPDSARTTTFTAHLITPETDVTSHYFWAATRDFDLDSDEHDRKVLQASIDVLTNEDGRMVEAQQRAMGTSDFMELKPAFIPTDAASVGARRVLDRLMKKEMAAAG